MTDLARFTDDPRMNRMVTHLLAVLTGVTDPDAEEQGGTFYGDAEVMAEALAFLVAMLTEADPAATTNQSLRLGAEEMARRVTLYAKAIRAENERTGTRLISSFLGTDEIVPKPDTVS